MGPIVAVALGGGAGSVLRYLVGRAAVNRGFEHQFATAGVNVIGALALGFLTGWLATSDASDSIKLGLTTGLLGGFTTFSAFMVESSLLAQDGRLGAATFNLIGPVLLGLAAAVAGLSLGRVLR
jgi:CrcB protein